MQLIQPRYLGKGDLTIEQMKKDFGAGLYSRQFVFLYAKNILFLLDTKKTSSFGSFIGPKCTFDIQTIGPLVQRSKELILSYPDHVKLILLSVAHLILDCCYNDVTTPTAFIFAIWFGFLAKPLRKQGVFSVGPKLRLSVG